VVVVVVVSVRLVGGWGWMKENDGGDGGSTREEGGRVTTAGIVQQKHVDGLVSGSQVMSGRDVARDV
jgi:hypothetical protein